MKLGQILEETSFITLMLRGHFDQEHSEMVIASARAIFDEIAKSDLDGSDIADLFELVYAIGKCMERNDQEERYLKELDDFDGVISGMYQDLRP